jgi:hypothetical protein
LAIVVTIEYETKLQERLSAPTVWKECALVKYTDSGILRNPYLTDSTVGTGTRGTGYTSTAVATTDDTVTINTYKYCAEHIDDADLAQKTFSDWMEVADNMGTLLNEALETAFMASYTQGTAFDNASIGGAAGNITVSVSNVKLIITAMKTAIRTAGGGELANRNGMFIVWREADFALVELLASSEGFNTADDALKNGIKQGFKYLGVEHYSTSKNTAYYIVGGVKKAMMVGIVKSTYGRVKEIINPVVSGAQISGVGLESRIDYKYMLWTKMIPIFFKISVA